jgi:cell division protein FtsB
MVIRRRLRAILYPLMLYGVSGAVGGYFLWHAINGERGLKTRLEYEQRIAVLRDDLRLIESEQAKWEHRITLLKGEVIDRDLLDEAARGVLGRLDRNDLVILLPRPAQ